ncbi:hypothetical protein L218DRAFT_568317 [Marasmius fiardii PR-910]|nr:hypothetical protein L218DRAFT_568317 [Marasmius fiardii PR-910]
MRPFKSNSLGVPIQYLICSWINVFLYSLEITLIAYFFLCHRKNRFQRFSLGGSLLLDTICTVIVCYSTWLLAHAVSREKQWWPGVMTILTYLISVVEQLYLVHQYWIIARNKIVLSLILLGVIVHLVFGFVAGVSNLVRLRPSFSTPSLAVAATTCAATDLFLAINMFRATRNIDTMDNPTQSLLYRLSIIAISSGIVTASATTLKIILLFISIEGFGFVMNIVGRLYTLTMVINCIALKRFKPSTTIFESVPLERETRTTRNSSDSRSPGSVVLTPLDFRTFTIPEGIETNHDSPST